MGLLNEPGSEDYVRHRNEERDRLIREGVFNPHRDEQSGMDYNDTTADFTNGSVMDTGSPEALKARVVEDEGFEDVGTSGVLVGEKGEEKESNLQSESQQPSESATESSVEAPKTDADANVPSSPKTPTTGLTDQVGEMELGNESPQEQQASTETQKEDVSVTAQPEDVPPPLFAGKEPESESTAQAEGATESTQEAQPANDGGAEDPAEQYIQYDTDGRPVVGDFLKIMFVENKVVPTILVSRLKYPLLLAVSVLTYHL
jgi:SIT4-associating protein SAP185/190